MEKFNIEISGSGLPTLTECGGGWTNTGSSRIICDKYYQKKKAIFVFTSGPLACSDHAVIPIRKGDHIICCDLWGGSFDVSIYQITGIDTSEKTAEAVLKSNKQHRGNYIGNPAVVAAIEKCKDYHCRCPYYIK